VAEAAGDPREGTAPPAAQWFLVEHPGPWGRVPLTQSGLDHSAVAALSAWARTAGGRPVLVRRPGRATGTGPRRWFRVDCRPGHESVRTGTFTAESELAEAVDAAGETYSGPLFLTCSHGRHDTCCAVRGRPVAAALAAVEPDGTWECSHIGGCRFAPAVVLLPHGHVLGGVPATAAAEVASRYRAGVLDPQYVRGRSAFAPAVQAAQHHARLATGALGVDALRPVHVAADGRPDETGTTSWHVELTDPDCSVLLRERTVSAGRPLTCAATTPGRIRLFDLLKITTPAEG
jgi:hypothetical protein